MISLSGFFTDHVIVTSLVYQPFTCAPVMVGVMIGGVESPLSSAS
jgi:tartrate dehydratase alpha subunit/fumarate hydratase class I-like protein